MDGLVGMQLADGVCGVISTRGAPQASASGFKLQDLLFIPTTLCPSIYDNIVHTPRGDIRVKHSVTNARKDRSHAWTYDGTVRWNWLGQRMDWFTVVCSLPKRVRRSMGRPRPAASQLGDTRRETMRSLYLAAAPR